MASYTYGDRQQYLHLLNRKADAGEVRTTVPQYKRNPLTHIQQSTYHTNITVSFERVEPLDFEAQIADQLANPELESSQHLVDFPKDDVEVTLSSREYRTVTPAEPDSWENLTPQVRSCVETYTKKWLTVTRRYQKCNRESRNKELNLPRQIFECDESFNLEMQGPQSSAGSQTDELQPETPELFIQQLLQPTTMEEVDLRNKDMRKSDRLVDMYMVYPPPDEISENFHLDLNSKEFRDIIQADNEDSFYFKKAIFSISHHSAEIYLVVKVEKVLQQGSIAECAEPYMSIKECETAKSKEKIGKLRFQAASFCQRLKPYRMPFAWAAVDFTSLISNSGSQNSLDKEANSGGAGTEVHSNSLDSKCNFPLLRPRQYILNVFYKQEEDKLSDEDLMKFIADEKKTSTLLRRQRRIPGVFRFTVSHINEAPAFCFSPDFLEVRPSSGENRDLTLEVLEFPVSGISVPHTTYRPAHYCWWFSLYMIFFFVFITPFLTQSGKSIMVEVAAGPSDFSMHEKLPMVLKVPRLNSSPLALCDRPFSLLGFGDVLIPGMLVAYCHRFDIQVQTSRIYFVACTVAYGIGLLITFIAVALMQTGQPALLYLVPCTLITSVCVACWRKEVSMFWSGSGFASNSHVTSCVASSPPTAPKLGELHSKSVSLVTDNCPQADDKSTATIPHHKGEALTTSPAASINENEDEPTENFLTKDEMSQSHC